MNYLEILNKIGLNEDEIKIYEILLTHGELSAGEIMRLTNLKRGDTYNKLYSLKKIGLVIQNEKKGKSTFFPQPPSELLTISSSKINTLEGSRKALLALLPDLMVNYSAISQKPAVSYFEGKKGLKQVYSLLNSSGQKEFLLIRSIEDHLRPELGKIIDAQIKKQVQLKIYTKALTPHVPLSKKTFLHEDEANLVLRRIIPPEMLEIPAQIMVWGDTVAISTFQKVLVCTVINNRAIATSFKTIFNFIWNTVKPYHDDLVSSWQSEIQKPD